MKNFKGLTIEKIRNTTSIIELGKIHTSVNHPSIGWSEEDKNDFNQLISMKRLNITKRGS